MDKKEKSTKITLPKVKLPKLAFKKFDMSKINLRKFNWLTVLGILCYLHILVIIPLLFGRKSPFVQFHVRQGIILLVVWVLLSFSFYVPLLPWLFIIYLIVAIVMGIVSVATGKERPLPLIGKFVK